MPIRHDAPIAILLAVLTALATVTTAAQPEGDRPRRPDGPPPDGRGPAGMMARADKDADGRVSRKEFIEMRTAEIEAMFDRIDGNGDGFLDEREVGAMAERMRAGGERMQRGGSDRPGGRRGPEEGFRRPPRQDGDPAAGGSAAP